MVLIADQAADLPELLERVTGIEPALSAWEADVLPLNYTRERTHCTESRAHPAPDLPRGASRQDASDSGSATRFPIGPAARNVRFAAVHQPRTPPPPAATRVGVSWFID